MSIYVLAAAPKRALRLGLFLGVVGPGLIVMLADTEVGSIVTAAQSGAEWGYRLLLLQLLLMPILYVVQELTVRLAIFTGKGHGELIRQTFGPIWAWVSVIGLGVAAVGALMTEFSGVAGVGELYGVPRAARASCVHLSPYPAALKKLRHSSGLKRLQMSPMACQSSSTVLAARARRWALSLENAISIGFRSGL